MECLIGVVCKDCVLLASDTSAAQSIIVLKKDEDKVVNIGPTAAMAIVGPGGDGCVREGARVWEGAARTDAPPALLREEGGTDSGSTRTPIPRSPRLLARAHNRDMFGGYISANLRLYSLRNGGMKLSTHAAANFTRGELAKALRSRNAYQARSGSPAASPADGGSRRWWRRRSCRVSARGRSAVRNARTLDSLPTLDRVHLTTVRAAVRPRECASNRICRRTF